MTVAVRMVDGTTYHLDRSLSAASVTREINEARGKGELIPLKLDSMPTGETVYLDPAHVMSIRDDRRYG